MVLSPVNIKKGLVIEHIFTLNRKDFFKNLKK